MIARNSGIALFVLGLALTQWAFRFHQVSSPVAFVQLLVLVADLLLAATAIALFLAGKEGLREALRNSPRLFAGLFGLWTAFGIVLAMEFGSRYYMKHHYRPPYEEVTEWEHISHPEVVLGDTTVHRCFVNDTLTYEVRYVSDSLGRRNVPLLRPDSMYRHFALLEVCSFPFGYGLADAQTFARALDSICGYRPYNYSRPGRGPQHILTMLHTTDLRSEISESNGRLLYLFIDDHVSRLIGSRRHMHMWAENFPYFYMEGDELMADNTFRLGRPGLTSFYKAMSQSAFIGLFDIDLPLYISDRHLLLTAKLLSKSQEEFLWHYPEGEFLVILSPNSRLATRLSVLLEEEGVPYVDYSELFDMERPEYKIHWAEKHPNGLYYQHIAEQLQRHFEAHPLP